MSYKLIKKELINIADNKTAVKLLRFFKTKKGEYGEGDKFYGIKVPVLHRIAEKYKSAELTEVEKLLNDAYHEARFVGLDILCLKYKKENENSRKSIAQMYIKNSKMANNWDLVDLSAPKILGLYIQSYPKEQQILYDFAKSKNLWQKRIALLSTYPLIRKKKFDHTLKISQILLNDKNDLIHKAIGWMLREIGKLDIKAEKEFLNKYYKQMPRTMLRYAIEKFDKKDKEHYMKK